MIRVAIADDQALVRTGFRVILDAEPDLEVTGEAADGREIVDLVQTRRPARSALSDLAQRLSSSA
jgi:DNA-binding NarL/FixJ family response regulator